MSDVPVSDKGKPVISDAETHITPDELDSRPFPKSARPDAMSIGKPTGSYDGTIIRGCVPNS